MFRVLGASDSILGFLPVSVNYVGIIPQKIIDCFQLGIVGVYGGGLTCYWGMPAKHGCLSMMKGG